MASERENSHDHEALPRAVRPQSARISGSSLRSRGEREGPWLEVAIYPSPVALRAPASPRGGEMREFLGRNRRRDSGALFMRGYARKTAGYANVTANRLVSTPTPCLGVQVLEHFAARETKVFWSAGLRFLCHHGHL